jgi:hypothetical protein
MAKHINADRRRIMKRMGAASIALPFYDLLLGNQAAYAACNNNRARRVIFFYTPNGFQGDAWWMDGAGGFGDSLSPLQPYASYVNYFQGLKVIHDGAQGHPDGVKATLTGNNFSDSRSIDVEIHEWIKQSDSASQRLYLGAGLPSQMNNDHYISYTSPGQVNNGLIGSPKAAWQNIFGNAGSDPGPKQSIIDVHKAELDDLRARLGTHEKTKFDRHLESLNELESQLGVSISGCNIMQQPTLDGYDQNDVSSVPAGYDLMIDMAFEAMKCGLSRVATIQFGVHTTDLNVKFPGSEMEANPDNRREYHGASHDYGGIFQQMKKWEMGKLASLLNKLQTTPEPDASCAGSMLDNTIIYVLSEIGNGSSHDYADTRHLMIGGAGGAWSTGRVINANGTRHSRNLVSIAHGMGHTGINSGYGGFGEGTMPGLF